MKNILDDDSEVVDHAACCEDTKVTFLLKFKLIKGLFEIII